MTGLTWMTGVTGVTGREGGEGGEEGGEILPEGRAGGPIRGSTRGPREK